jgi:hypothetical protein
MIHFRQRIRPCQTFSPSLLLTLVFSRLREGSYYENNTPIIYSDLGLDILSRMNRALGHETEDHTLV